MIKKVGAVVCMAFCLISSTFAVQIGDLLTYVERALSEVDLDVVKHLVAKGVDINYADEYGNTVLSFVVRSAKLDIVKYLIERGANTNAIDKFGDTVLMEAIYTGELNRVKCLVEHNANVNRRTELGTTALIRALECEKFNSEIVIYLVKCGADVNVVDKYGNTPLSLAARLPKEGFGIVVKCLIERGADIHYVNKSGDKIWNTILMRAIDVGNMDVIMCLVEHGADPNTKFGGVGGHTVLMFAAAKGDINAVRHLVKYGAKINVKNAHGVTALMIAKSLKHDHVVAYLEECNKGCCIIC